LIGVIIANIWQQPNGVVAGTAALVALIILGILVILLRKEQEKSGRNERILISFNEIKNKKSSTKKKVIQNTKTWRDKKL